MFSGNTMEKLQLEFCTILPEVTDWENAIFLLLLEVDKSLLYVHRLQFYLLANKVLQVFILF